MDPDQAGHYVGPDLDRSCLLKEFFEKVDFVKISADDKSMQNYQVGKEFNVHAQLSVELDVDMCLHIQPLHVLASSGDSTHC